MRHSPPRRGMRVIPAWSLRRDGTDSSCAMQSELAERESADPSPSSRLSRARTVLGGMDGHGVVLQYWWCYTGYKGVDMGLYLAKAKRCPHRKGTAPTERPLKASRASPGLLFAQQVAGELRRRTSG